MSAPSNLIMPPVGSSKRRIARPAVVLPLPELADQADDFAQRDRQVQPIDGAQCGMAAAQRSTTGRGRSP